MKKVLFLSIIFFFALALAGFNPVKADSVIVNGSYTDTDTLSQTDYDELQNTALLLKYLQNGGVVDVSNVSDGYSVSDLVSDFGDFVKEVVPDLIDVINPFQSKFEYTPLGNAMLNNNMYKFMGLLPFYALSGNDEPIPEPPVEYNSYIDFINGSGFFFKNWNNGTPSQGQINSGFTSMQNYYPNSNYSWFGHQLNVSWGIDNSNLVVCSEIKTVNIYSVGDTYSFALPVTALPAFNAYYASDGNNLYVGQLRQSYIGQTNIIASDNSMINNSIYKNANKSYTYQCTGTLVQCLDYVKNNMKNVNIYVDDVPWSIVGNTQNYNLQIYNDTVSPVATNDYGYVHWVYDYEIFFRIDRIWNILQDILDNMGNGGQTIIRWPDIDDVIVDVDGQPAVAVKIYTPDSNIDEEYLSKYGPLIPVFIPLATPVINDSDILLIASTPMSALPDDLLDVFGYIFIGCLFVCFIHRLLE